MVKNCQIQAMKMVESPLSPGIHLEAVHYFLYIATCRKLHGIMAYTKQFSGTGSQGGREETMLHHWCQFLVLPDVEWLMAHTFPFVLQQLK